MSPFQWSPKKNEAAVWLAQGYTINETAEHVHVSEKTIDRWKRDIEFTQEVDRLSLMVGISSRAERLRIVQKVIRNKTADDVPLTEKDLLEWLKFAQSETDGIKLDLTKLLTALTPNAAPVAVRGPGGAGGGEGQTDE
jgi:transposase